MILNDQKHVGAHVTMCPRTDAWQPGHLASAHTWFLRPKRPCSSGKVRLWAPNKIKSSSTGRRYTYIYIYMCVVPLQPSTTFQLMTPLGPYLPKAKRVLRCSALWGWCTLFPLMSCVGQEIDILSKSKWDAYHFHTTPYYTRKTGACVSTEPAAREMVSTKLLDATCLRHFKRSFLHLKSIGWSMRSNMIKH